MPDEHTGTPLAGAVQVVPQVPQFCTSEPVLVQEPSQFVSVAPQSSPQLPIKQTSPLSQGLLQALQCSALDIRFTQTPEHSVRPLGQLLPHTPALQVAVPPLGAVHLSPQSPQFCVSLETSIH